MTGIVRAAGGLVLERQNGEDRVLLVHRPRYDDWTLPKGKCKQGESDEKCALREVEEETGLRCELGRKLGTVSYVDHRGRNKAVRYWEMTPVGGAFTPGHEIDEIRWLTREDAVHTMTYAHDRELLKSRERERTDVG